MKFDIDKFIWHVLKSFLPERHDIGYWIQVAKEWEKEKPVLLPIAFESVMTAWVDGDYVTIDYNWIESLRARSGCFHFKYLII